MVTPTLKSDKGVRNKEVGDSAVKEYSVISVPWKKSRNDLFIGDGWSQTMALGLLWALSPFLLVGLTHRDPTR